MSQKKETFYLSNVRFIIPFQMQCMCTLDFGKELNTVCTLTTFSCIFFLKKEKALTKKEKKKRLKHLQKKIFSKAPFSENLFRPFTMNGLHL